MYVNYSVVCSSILTLIGRCGPILMNIVRLHASCTCEGCIAVGGAMGGANDGTSLTEDYKVNKFLNIKY